MKLKILVGNGRKIGLLALPFLVIGITLNILFSGCVQRWRPAAGADCRFHRSADSRRRHLVLVGLSDTHQDTEERADHHRALCADEAPAVYRRGAVGAAMGGLSARHVAGAADRHCGVYWLAAVFARRRSRTLAKIFGESWTEYCRKVKIPWL